MHLGLHNSSREAAGLICTDWALTWAVELSPNKHTARAHRSALVILLFWCALDGNPGNVNIVWRIKWLKHWATPVLCTAFSKHVLYVRGKKQSFPTFKVLKNDVMTRKWAICQRTPVQKRECDLLQFPQTSLKADQTSPAHCLRSSIYLSYRID